MTYHFVIEGRLPGLNQMIASQGRPWWMGRKIKEDAMQLVMKQLISPDYPQFKNPVKMRFAWIEPNARRDRDNVTGGGSKIILDAMQKMGMIQGDSRKWVVDIQNDTSRIDPKRPRVEIWVEEIC